VTVEERSVRSRGVCPVACTGIRWEDASCTLLSKKVDGVARKQIDDLIYARGPCWARSTVKPGFWAVFRHHQCGPCNGRVAQGVPVGSQTKFYGTVQKLVDVYTQTW
jgi:hypothetical protein